MAETTPSTAPRLDRDLDRDTRAACAPPETPAGTHELRERVIAAFSGLPPGWEMLLEEDAEFVAAFTDFVAPAVTAPALTAKHRALLTLAVAVSPTTLDEAAVQRHVAAAFDQGATRREVLDVIELVSILGVHSLTAGLALLTQTRNEGQSASAAEDLRGYWAVFERHFPGFHEALRAQLPAVEVGYRALNRTLWRPDGLEPLWREMVFVVADLATTHLFTQGAALHIENALHYGASQAQIAEAIALTLSIGGRSIEIGLPALLASAPQTGGLLEGSRNEGGVLR